MMTLENLINDMACTISEASDVIEEIENDLENGKLKKDEYDMAMLMVGNTLTRLLLQKINIYRIGMHEQFNKMMEGEE